MVWVLPNLDLNLERLDYMVSLSWSKLILLLKGQVLRGCVTTRADTNNVLGMHDWERGEGGWQHGCLQPDVKLHPKAYRSKVAKSSAP